MFDVTAIIAGIAAGLTVSAILGIRVWIRHHYRRWKQTRRIVADVLRIEHFLPKMPDEIDKEWITKQVAREMRERLNNRCPDMKADEVDEARFALLALESELGALEHPKFLVKLMKEDVSFIQRQLEPRRRLLGRRRR